MGNKKILYRLDLDSLLIKGKNKSKKNTYSRLDYIQELENEQGVTLTRQNLYHLRLKLPYVVTAISIMANKLNITIDDCIDEVSKDLFILDYWHLMSIRNEEMKKPLRLYKWVEELKKEEAFNLTERGINKLGKKLPNIFCVLSAMAKKAGVKIDDIVVKI